MLRKKKSLSTVKAIGLGFSLSRHEEFHAHALSQNRPLPQSPSQSTILDCNVDGVCLSTKFQAAARASTSSTASSAPLTIVFEGDKSPLSTPPTSIEYDSEDEDCQAVEFDWNSPTLTRTRTSNMPHTLSNKRPKGKRKVLKVEEQEHYWSMQEMLVESGLDPKQARVVTPDSTINKINPLPHKELKTRASLADLTNRLFSSFFPAQQTDLKAAKTPLRVTTEKECKEVPKTSPRSVSSHTSADSLSESESRTGASDDEEADETHDLHEDDTVHYAQIRAQEWVRSCSQASFVPDTTIRSPPSVYCASFSPVLSDQSTLNIHVLSGSVPLYEEEQNPTTPTRSLRHYQSVPSIRTVSKKQVAPKLLRKTTSTASLKFALSPLLTLDSELTAESSVSSATSRRQVPITEQDMKRMNQVVKLPSPKRCSASQPCGKRDDVRNIFSPPPRSPHRPPPRMRRQVSAYAQSRSTDAFPTPPPMSRTATTPASSSRKLTAKQSLQQLLDAHPKAEKTLPFPIGLKLPAGGFRRSFTLLDDEEEVYQKLLIPEIRIETVA